MPWKRMLAYITGSVNEDLLRRIEYLLEENRVLRQQIDKRILLTDSERRTLAERASALGKLMADTVTIVKPETILKWHRTLVAKKFDGSRFRRRHGRPPIEAELEDLVVRLAREPPDEANEVCCALSVASQSCRLVSGQAFLEVPNDLPLNRNDVSCQSSTVPVALLWLIKSRAPKSDEYFYLTGILQEI